jgi:hypothetical protein
MEKTLRVFRNHEEARRHNAQEMARISPDDRIRMALALHEWYYRDDPAAQQGLAQVYRVVQRESR